MRHTIPCPKCKVEGKARIDENLLGEKVYALRCKECGSISTCQDGIHWKIMVQNNTEKED